MKSSQQNRRDGILDVMIEAALRVKGVERAIVERTESGYHLKVVPEPGADIEVLRKDIRSAEEEHVPLLAGDIRITFEPKDHQDASADFKGRVELARAHIASNQKGRFNITVRVKKGDSPSTDVNEAECTKKGAYLAENVMRLSAEATLDAVLEIAPEIVDGAVLGAQCQEISGNTVVLVLLTLVLSEGKINVSGSACIRDEVHLAAVIATLRAINRYLEFAEMG